jgi:hypothetical protein
MAETFALRLLVDDFGKPGTVGKLMKEQTKRSHMSVNLSTYENGSTKGENTENMLGTVDYLTNMTGRCHVQNPTMTQVWLLKISRKKTRISL